MDHVLNHATPTALQALQWWKVEQLGPLTIILPCGKLVKQSETAVCSVDLFAMRSRCVEGNPSTPIRVSLRGSTMPGVVEGEPSTTLGICGTHVFYLRTADGPKVCSPVLLLLPVASKLSWTRHFSIICTLKVSEDIKHFKLRSAAGHLRPTLKGRSAGPTLWTDQKGMAWQNSDMCHQKFDTSETMVN